MYTDGFHVVVSFLSFRPICKKASSTAAYTRRRDKGKLCSRENLWLEAHGYSYVLAVACDEPIGIQTASGRKRMTVAEAEALLVQAENWQRLCMSDGTKGPRLFDWSVIPILHGWEDDGRHFLLIRRCLDEQAEKAYYARICPDGYHPCRDGQGYRSQVEN
jgi:hypothetical protein